MRIGFGYDVHKLVENRPLIIGGVTIPHNKGLLGHSDADVLVHSIMDALLGAAALGDIGKHFPDSDKNFKNISSLLLLSKVKSLINKEGYEIINIDCTIIAQKPKMLPYIEDMRENICKCLNLNDKMLNIKATTEEGLGFTGKEDGISANAICLLN
ncbi:2-C-methyl-D-erythritol 2,4-cyclodiphosphate synthase [Clostridium sporogenes]|uniref:2-C-methyl-D-erythritol 2,4-cyclodiphosphate synthase n=1 Tax=Clostridium sporogenes TaxID=1509 RepID=UPI0013D8A8E9|nr:2-C-methyl-D-erythritol 2,4-cyclodiphosphate synthase [Clostridium sporogenes]NFV14472.1 2-C-methyl-D-erythritol 2,4-cyclodiphosphate synthase [Clostridium sporogenes]